MNECGCVFWLVAASLPRADAFFVSNYNHANCHFLELYTDFFLLYNKWFSLVILGVRTFSWSTEHTELKSTHRWILCSYEERRAEGVGEEMFQLVYFHGWWSFNFFFMFVTPIWFSSSCRLLQIVNITHDIKWNVCARFTPFFEIFNFFFSFFLVFKVSPPLLWNIFIYYRGKFEVIEERIWKTL